MNRSKEISILIVDDYKLTRVGISRFLQLADDIEIIGEADNGDDAINLVQKLKPNILLLDIHMPGRPAREIVEWVNENCPDVHILMLTAYHDDAQLAEFMSYGVSGFLDKSLDNVNLITAIYQAVRGETVFSREQLARVRQWNKMIGINLY